MRASQHAVRPPRQVVKPVLELVDVTKRFGEQLVVDRFSLEVARGEFVTLLGPSGCGKTTLLRMIAGFEHPTGGDILIDGRSVVSSPPEQRPVNTVFQRYALFPHLDVAENIAFGLDRRRLGDAEVAGRVDSMLSLVRLPNYGTRRTYQLSGGEAQRVALARALVLEPQVLLLDEPLSALDLRIRQQLQEELRRIHHEVGLTFCYVTHDQEEAMKLSDRVVVVNEGRIEQVGTPQEIYWNPASAFSAHFVGESNMLPGVVTALQDSAVAVRPDGLDVALCAVPGNRAYDVGQAVHLVVRPDVIAVGTPGAEHAFANRLDGTVGDAVFTGATIAYEVEVASGTAIRASVPWRDGMRMLARHERVALTWSDRDTRLLPR